MARIFRAALAAVVLSLSAATPANAAFPAGPDEGATVDAGALAFSVGFDPGDLRAKVLLLDTDTGYALPDDDETWSALALASPWLTPEAASWRKRMRPGFYAWRVCSFSEATDPDTVCDLGPEIRYVTVTDGPWRPCRGTYRGGFFNHITARRISCTEAHRVTRAWLRRVRIDTGYVPRRMRVGSYRCRFLLIPTDENPYGVTTCTRPGGRAVRFYGTS